MRDFPVSALTAAVKQLFFTANYEIGADVEAAVSAAMQAEPSPTGRAVLGQLLENYQIARQERIAICQDTGMACVFLEIGQDVHLVGGLLEDAVNAGVRRGYSDGYLRKSIVKDPLRRVNTGDNTPAYINTEIVSGDKVRIIVAPKGFGSENMSQVKMLPPSAGEKGVKDFVVDVCAQAGANPCPPVVIGVGIGGTFDRAALMAKKALLKPVDMENEDPYYRDMENELLERINKLGIGPQGFGGRTTALSVKINAAPTHIAGLPVAVNVNCHVSRHKEAVI